MEEEEEENHPGTLPRSVDLVDLWSPTKKMPEMTRALVDWRHANVVVFFQLTALRTG